MRDKTILLKAQTAAAGRIRFRRGALAACLAAIGASAIGVGAARGDSDTVQRTPMQWHKGSGEIPMSPVGDRARAKLTRTSSGISYSIKTHSLRADHAYTVWVVVVNDPAECESSPCSPLDIFENPDTDAQVLYGGSGHVVGSSGKAGFGGHVSRGPLPQGWLPDQGLENPREAEVHLVLNDHGPKLPEYMPGMIRTYRGGCRDEGLPPIFPASAKADGEPGPNTCALWQVAVFE